MMKRILPLLLVLALAVAASGCSGNNKVKTSGSLPVLKWYVPGDKPSDEASVEEAVNKITSEKIGAKVDLDFIDVGAFNDRMTMNMASGNDFDVCFTGYVNKYRLAVKKGGFLQLDKYLEKSKQLLNSIPDYAWKAAKVDGNIYAVPNMQIMAHSLQMYTFKDLADKYGLNPADIHKTEDIETYLEKIKKNESNLYPFRTDWGEDSFPPEVAREGVCTGVVAKFNEDGSITVQPRTEDKDYKYAVKNMSEWFQKGYIRPDVTSVMDDTQDFNNAKYAVWLGGYKPGYLAELKLKFGREVINMPVAKTVLESTAGLSAMTAVNNKSKNPDLAIKLIELVNTDKGLFNILCYGIEGKHYNLDENGRIKAVENSGYAKQSGWKFGNQFNAYLLPGQSEDVWEQTVKMNDEAAKSPLLGFVANTDEIQNEISQCQTIINEYKYTGNGAISPEKYYEEFQARLNEAGVQKIIEEMQKQLDNWKIAN